MTRTIRQVTLLFLAFGPDHFGTEVEINLQFQISSNFLLNTEAFSTECYFNPTTRAEVLDSWDSTDTVTRCPLSNFQPNDVRFQLFESSGVRFQFCSTLPDIVRLCSTLLEYTGHCLTLFDFIGSFSFLLGINQTVLIYDESRTSFDRSCQVTCQKPQPGAAAKCNRKCHKL